MNSEHLTYIAQNTNRISGQDALELEELCRKFPAFSTPFILLAKYYHQTGDYRAEEAIQKAALRVHNRSWLADFILDKTTQTNGDTLLAEEVKDDFSTPQIENPDSGQDEINTVANDLQELQDIEFHHEQVVIESTDYSETAEETTTEKTQDVIVAESSIESLTVSSLFIPEDPNDCVFEEIESFETGNEASILGYSNPENRELEEPATLISAHEVLGAGGMILPDTEETTMSEIGSELTIQSDSETLFIAAAPYQIEQFYPETGFDSGEQPNDFYSWLSNPSSRPETEITEEVQPEITDNPKSQQRSIIDRFIETNPGVIRPRKDFFTPETAAKKSEHLPENLATETLAKVYLQQGNTDGAIRIYERLMLKFPEKNTYFADLIEKIKQENNP